MQSDRGTRRLRARPHLRPASSLRSESDMTEPAYGPVELELTGVRIAVMILSLLT